MFQRKAGARPDLGLAIWRQFKREPGGNQRPVARTQDQALILSERRDQIEPGGSSAGVGG